MAVVVAQGIPGFLEFLWGFFSSESSMSRFLYEKSDGRRSRFSKSVALMFL